jgi:hypothetical protein
MVMRLSVIRFPSDFELPALRKRAQESSKSIKTIHYRCIADGQEVAFVSLDRWPELGEMVLYEIFVPRELRRQGIGSAALSEVENTAINEGMFLIRLRPRPLDGGISEADLAKWYSQRGYECDPNIAGDMQKKL